MLSSEIEIQLKTAEQAAVKQDNDAFKKVFPDFDANPRPGDWTGAHGNLPWNEISKRCPHTMHKFLHEHHFDSWEKFVHCMQSLGDQDAATTQFENAVNAIIYGDTERLGSLLRNNPSLIYSRSTRKHRATLLHYTAANGVEWYRQKTPPTIVEITQLLLNAGADINAVADMYSKDTTIGLAATSVHPFKAGVQQELLQLLLDNGAIMTALPGENLLAACLANGRLEAARFLASRGAEVNLEAAAGLGMTSEVKKFFMEDGSLKDDISVRQLQRGFCSACGYGMHDTVTFLLQRGIDAHFFKEGLHWAAVGGQANVMKVLLEWGAPLESRNQHGGTVLSAALWGAFNNDAGKDFKPIIRMLVDAGADTTVDGLAEYVEKVLQ